MPVPVRLVLFRRAERGQTVAEIADALGLRPRTVRALIHRFRADAAKALEPAYQRCGRHQPWPNQKIFAAAIDLRRHHASWGAGYIRVWLQEGWPNEPLPSTRTLQRWFARAGLGPAPAGTRPRTSQPRASRPHQVWQIDAVEGMRLQSGTHASWLRVTDEFSGAVLHTKVFPLRRFSQVGAKRVQAELRQAFARWGRPEAVRVDNGAPWGSTGDLPTPLALWLIGLAIKVVRNPPRQPRRNAVVERTQGVSQRWAEPQTCASVEELQQRLEDADRIQRERYPSIAGRSRLESYPELAQVQRAYSEAWEKRHWSLPRVLDCLSDYAVPRQVRHHGDVSIYDRDHWVGKRWAGRTVYVTVDAETQEWIYQDERGSVIRREAAKDLTRERLINMELGEEHR